MQAQLATIGNTQSARFATARVGDRKSQSSLVRRRATKDPGFLLADMVAVLSLGTAVGIVIYMVLAMH